MSKGKEQNTTEYDIQNYQEGDTASEMSDDEKEN